MKIAHIFPETKRVVIKTNFNSKKHACGIESIMAAIVIAKRIQSNLMTDMTIMPVRKIWTYLKEKYIKISTRGHKNSSMLENTKCHLCDWKKRKKRKGLGVPY